MEKPCNYCKKTKPFDQFNKNRTYKDGMAYYCKDCSRARQTEYRKENPEASAASQRKWREKNPEAVLKNASAFNHKFRRATSHATNKGMAWSEADDATVMRRDVPLLELCKILGRTYGSCSIRRTKLAERAELREVIEGVQRRLTEQ